MPTSPQDTPLVSFHLGQAPDAEGRLIDEIRRWDFDELESVHDYIQWLFPTRRASAFNADAPPLDDATVAAFHADGRLRASLLESLRVMLAFYGFALREAGGRPAVERSAAWDERRRNWLTPGNHNLLRLTRILDSLRTLGLGPHADALLAALEGAYAEHAGVIGPRTVGFWRSAGR